MSVEGAKRTMSRCTIKPNMLCEVISLLVLALAQQLWLTPVAAGSFMVNAGSQSNSRSPAPVSGYHERYYEGESSNVSLILDSLLKGYDKRLRPKYKGPPVEVGITMFVSSVSSISEVDMDFTLDMYFRQYWQDQRLNFSDTEEELCISNEMLEKIWWPDTFFANAKDTKFHHATTKNAFLRIKPSGHMTQSLRLTVTAMCTMDLTLFPMDSQFCSLEIESYGYSVKDIKYTWMNKNESVSIAPDVQLPTFKVLALRTKEKTAVLTTGNYSRLAVIFYFGRSLGYYLIHIYVPSCLIVVLSWVSFWLSRDAVPARVALGITTVLTMTTLISSTNAALPKISYLKSIDIYLLICFVMVFASLLEYAAVSYLAKLLKRRVKRRGSDIPHIPPPPPRCDHHRPPRSPSKNRARDYQQESFNTHSGGMSRTQLGPKTRVTVKASKLPHINGARLLKHDRHQHHKLQHSPETEVRLTSSAKMDTECDLRSGKKPNYISLGALPAEDPTSDCAIVERGENSCSLHCSRPSTIDKYSRVLFPLVFILFNLLYWMTYLNINVEEAAHEDWVYLGKG